MSKLRPSKSPPIISISRWLGLVLALCAGSLFASLSAQPQPSAANVNSLFVDRFSGGSESATLRDSLVRHLSKSGFHIAPARKDADAVIEGTGQVGFADTSPRIPGRRQPTDRRSLPATFRWRWSAPTGSRSGLAWLRRESLCGTTSLTTWLAAPPKSFMTPPLR